MKKISLLTIIPCALMLFSCMSGGGEEDGPDEDLPYEDQLPSRDTIIDNLGDKYKIEFNNNLYSPLTNYVQHKYEGALFTSKKEGQSDEDKELHYNGYCFKHENNNYNEYYYNVANEDTNSDGNIRFLIKYTDNIKYSAKQNTTILGRSCTKYNTLNNSTGKSIEVYIDNITGLTLKYIEQEVGTTEATSIDLNYNTNLNDEINEIAVPSDLFNKQNRYDSIFSLSSAVDLSTYSYQNGSASYLDNDGSMNKINRYSMSYNAENDSTAFETICQKFFDANAKFKDAMDMPAGEDIDDLTNDGVYEGLTKKDGNRVARIRISQYHDTQDNFYIITITADQFLDEIE